VLSRVRACPQTRLSVRQSFLHLAISGLHGTARKRCECVSIFGSGISLICAPPDPSKPHPQTDIGAGSALVNVQSIGKKKSKFAIVNFDLPFPSNDFIDVCSSRRGDERQGMVVKGGVGKRQRTARTLASAQNRYKWHRSG